MNYGKVLIGTMLLSATTFNAQATLTTSANGLGVYDSGLNVTWLQDANLLDTLETKMGYAALSDAIIKANGGVVNDTLGTHVLKGAESPEYLQDIREYGYVTWWGAQAFVHYLNTIDYGGSNHWALPSSVNGIEGDNNSTQYGQLYYDEGFGATPTYIWDASLGHYVIDSPFSNNQFDFYWSGTEAPDNPVAAWAFNTDNVHGGAGYPFFGKASGAVFAWAVTPGQLPAVPEPGMIWLFSSGVLVLLGLKRRDLAG